MNNPDKWVLVELANDTADGGDKLVKVLGSWYGGFAGVDSWRMSSGVVGPATRDERGCIHLTNYSGSVYVVHEDAYGMSALAGGVFSTLQESLAAANDGNTIRLLTKEEALSYVDSIMKPSHGGCGNCANCSCKH